MDKDTVKRRIAAAYDNDALMVIESELRQQLNTAQEWHHAAREQMQTTRGAEALGAIAGELQQAAMAMTTCSSLLGDVNVRRLEIALGR